MVIFAALVELHISPPNLIQYQHLNIFLSDIISVVDPEGGGGDVCPPKRKKRGGRSSVPLLSISAFIHSSVKCNKSLYIALLVYLITFEAVDD